MATKRTIEKLDYVVADDVVHAKKSFEKNFVAPVIAPVLEPTARPPEPSDASPASAGSRPPKDAEKFAAQLDRRSKIGEAGELVAVKDEIQRLARFGCSSPEAWVDRNALTNGWPQPPSRVL